MSDVSKTLRRRPRLLLYTESTLIGGAERYLYDIACRMSEHCDVRVGCNPDAALLEYLEPLRRDIAIDVLPVFTVGGSAAFQLSQRAGINRVRQLQIVRKVGDAAVRVAHRGPNIAILRRWLLQHRPDILHINAPAYPGLESCRAAVIAAALTQTPVVGMFVHTQATARRWPAIEEAAFDQLIGKYLDTVLVASSASADALVYRRGFPRRQITCIPNGVVVPSLSHACSAMERRALGLPEEGMLIGVVGRLDTNKGQGYLLEAAAIVRRQIEDVHVVVVGEGPCESQYREQATRLGLADGAIFTGYRRDVLELMRAFDILVMPTVDYEALGYVLLEAMSVGVPVIGTRVGGIPEIVHHGLTGLLVPPHDVPELAGALLRLLSDPVERRRLGQAARTRIEADFSMDTMVARTLKHYIQLLDAARSGVA